MVSTGLRYGAKVTFTGKTTNRPASGTVLVQIWRNGAWRPAANGVLHPTGGWRAACYPPSAGRLRWRAIVRNSSGTTLAATPGIDRDVARARGTLAISPGKKRVRSESSVRVSLRYRAGHIKYGGRKVSLYAKLDGGKSWKRVASAWLNGQGRATFRPVSVWKKAAFRAKLASTASVPGATSNIGRISTKPRAKVEKNPKGGAPKYGRAGSATSRPKAVGGGANAKISRISTRTWRRMMGRSWQRGCPAGRSQLRYVTVNYWGFDGYRYRGEMVVAAGAATKAARAFTALYNQKFPVRQMRLPDDYGRGPYRGANDYKSMKADNTSAFNCRYVVGAERARVMSPHAYGYAIDINPWENPYYSARGIYPSKTNYYRKSATARSVFRAKSPAVRALARYGWVWRGPSWHDYHHFGR